VHSKLTVFPLGSGTLDVKSQEILAFKTSKLTALTAEHPSFLVAAGKENKIKVWNNDSAFQSFSAHTSPVRDLVFTMSCETLVSIGTGFEGIYFWRFAVPR
jgi:WD40 repeat protein